MGADRDHQADRLRRLWASGPPLSVAVATGVDERLHHSSVELAALIDESVTALSRRVLPSLAANPHWGHGTNGRYRHGGASPEESIVAVAEFS